GGGAVRGLEALRERLRANDIRITLEKNKSWEEKEADRRRKSKLPALADALRSYFAHLGRSTGYLDSVANALASSSRHTGTKQETKDRLCMLAEMVPEWCTINEPPTASPLNAASPPLHPRIGGAGDGKGSRPLTSRVSSVRAVVRVNKNIHYREVRRMIEFMTG
ncbi:unnamed protein product, partial [Choristocarpus tenellus]